MNKLPKKQTAGLAVLLAVGAAFASLFFRTTPIEAKTLQVLSNQKEWYSIEMKATDLEVQLQELRARQAELSNENNQLRNEIDSSLASVVGFQ